MGQAAIMAIQAGSVQFQINFTRENEEEADRVGMQTLAESQFDPRSMPTFFERLQQSSRYYGQNIPEFLRTHPVTASRISDTRGRAETYPYKQYPDSLGYQLAKAKIRVLTASNATEALKYFQARLSQGTIDQRTVARYGEGLALLKSQKYNEADVIFQSLAKSYPNQSQYASALARNALEAHDFNTALSRYQNLIAQYPENEAIKLEYIESLLKVSQPEKARAGLAALSPETKQLPVYWELLAQSYSALKQPAESHRYLAEYYYAVGHTQDAIAQIKLAQKSKGLNFQLSSILAERLNFFLSEEVEARRGR
jgi:predicted Zn-dependent protease